MLVAALPTVLVCQEDYILTSACQAGHAVRPAAGDNVLSAIDGIGEVDDRFLEAGGFGYQWLNLTRNSPLSQLNNCPILLVVILLVVIQPGSGT